MNQPQRILREVFGFDGFLPGQEAVIGHLLAGHSAAAVFPTGGGKSLCYQLPALALPGLTLVVSPLIALMKDQIDALERRGIAAARLDSSLDAEGYRETMAVLRAGGTKLLYVAPERFNNERFREQVKALEISLFAVDEAHCISEWGHNFRPDYLKLADYARRWGAERVLALTATATPPVLEDIRRGFDIAPEHAVRTGFYRPNLTLLTTPLSVAERDRALLDKLGSRPLGPTIVYVTLQRTAREVAERLRQAGFDAMHYHAGMKSEERSAVQERFAASDWMVVVATIAFGMGIDKADVRYVYHYNLPKSLENLAQEIGRAGRDGEPSICEILVCPEDQVVLANFAYGDTPSRSAVTALVAELFAGGQSLELDLDALARRHDLRALVLRTLLTYLELDGFLEAGTPFYSAYSFKPNVGSAEILQRFEGERRAFLAALFRQAEKRRTWFSLDIDQAAGALGEPRSRLVRALDYLGEQSLLEVKAAGVRHRYRTLRTPDDPAGLAADLHQRTLAHEGREIARLEQVLALAQAAACRSGLLCAHFGEPREQPCGHCSWCLGDRTAPLPSTISATIDETRWRDAEAVRAEHPEALRDARAFARFLTGLRSPALSRHRLGRHPLFGILEEVPFPEVLARARAPSD